MKKKLCFAPVSFPHDVRVGSVVVKIYKTTNRGKDAFYISHFVNGKRSQRMFRSFDDAETEAKKMGGFHARGETAVLNLTNADQLSYICAMEALRPTGVSLEVAAKEYAAAWLAMNGRASIIEAAKEFTRRNLARNRLTGQGTP